MPRPLTSSDRSAIIRLASSLPSGSPEKKAILSGLVKGKTASGHILAKVFTATGTLQYTAEELADMLDGKGGIKSMYRSADNLPKWLWIAGNVTVSAPGSYGIPKTVPNRAAKNFPGGPWDLRKPGAWTAVANIIQGILDGGVMRAINVDSSDPDNNGIR